MGASERLSDWPASMRPQRNAAENGVPLVNGGQLSGGFNEAAA